MGILDVFAAQSDRSAPTPLQALPRTAGERFEAEWSATFAPDRYFTRQGALRERAETVIGQLREATGEALRNPYDAAPTPEEMMRLGNAPAVAAERLQKLRERAATVREMFPDKENLPQGFLDTDFEGQIALEAQQRRRRAARFEDTGSGWAGFAGGALGESVTPLGLLGFAVPVTRLPTAISSTIGRGFLANVSREAALQAGANVALQGFTEALDAASRRDFGTVQSAREVIANLGGAAVLGGVIGGGVRALHLGWLKLSGQLRDAAPLEVRDAFRVLEADALYSGQNRLGVEPGLHERAFDSATRDVMLGRPVRTAELLARADTPMTALATILREPGPLRIEGVDTALDRIRALPDSEIEGFAREVMPRSFARLDRLDGELNALRSRLDDLNTRTSTIYDLVDPDTGERLRAIDADLARQGLSRKARNDLERERDMIMGTVDPRDRLPSRAEKARQAEIAAIRKEMEQLEEKHADARATADAATAKLRKRLVAYQEEIERAIPGLRQMVAELYRPARPDAAYAGVGAAMDRIAARLDAEGLQRKSTENLASQIPELRPPPEWQPTPDELRIATRVSKGWTPEAPLRKPQSLLDFVRRNGGLSQGTPEAAELVASDLGRQPGLLRKRGRQADHMAQAAADAGFRLGSETRYGSGVDVDAFVRALIEDVSGTRKHFPDDDHTEGWRSQQRYFAEFDRYLNEALGIDLKGRDPREVSWVLSVDEHTARLISLTERADRLGPRESLELASRMDAEFDRMQREVLAIEPGSVEPDAPKADHRELPAATLDDLERYYADVERTAGEGGAGRYPAEEPVAAGGPPEGRQAQDGGRSPDPTAREVPRPGPASLEAALERAELWRQARIVQDTTPAPFEARATPPKSDEALQSKALDLEAERVTLGKEFEVQIGDRTMSAADAIEAADRQIKEAEIAMNCAAGSL